MKRGGPKKINWWIGYRTRMSKKNKDTWTFAHVYCGKIWFLFGFVLSILSIGAVILFEYESSLIWIALAQLLVLMIPLILTEIALRKKFDKNGEPRDNN